MERYKLAHLLIDRITLYKDHIIMDIKHHGLKSLIRDLIIRTGTYGSRLCRKRYHPVDDPNAGQVKRWNGRKLIIAPCEPDAAEPEEDEPNAIAKKLAQAYRLMAMIEAGKYSTRTRLD